MLLGIVTSHCWVCHKHLLPAMKLHTLNYVIDRYMKRLAKHPVVRKDAMFRSFIQDKEVSKTLKPIATFKTAIKTFKSRIDLFKAQVTVTERDAWFKVGSTQFYF